MHRRRSFLPAVLLLALVVPCLARDAVAVQLFADGAVHRTSQFPPGENFEVQDSPSGQPTRLVVDTNGLFSATARGHSIIDSEAPNTDVSVYLYDHAQGTLNGVESVNLHDESHAHVIGGGGFFSSWATVGGSATLLWESPDYLYQLNVTGNGLADIRSGVISIVGQNNATILLDDSNAIDDLRLFDTSFVSMANGRVGTGEGSIRLEGQSRFDMHGGVIGSPIEVVSDARLEIFGGSIHDAGVSPTKLDVQQNGIIRIHGSDFVVNGAPVGFGLLDAVSGQIGGTTLTGESFQFIHFTRSNGGRIELVPVPEPRLAALLLTGIAFLGMRRRVTASG